MTNSVNFQIGVPGWRVNMEFFHPALHSRSLHFQPIEISARRDEKISYKHASLFFKEFSISQDHGEAG